MYVCLFTQGEGSHHTGPLPQPWPSDRFKPVQVESHCTATQLDMFKFLHYAGHTVDKQTVGPELKGLLVTEWVQYLK